MKTFSLLVLYVGVMLCKESLVVIVQLSQIMAKNGRTHFARVGLDKHSNCNRDCKIVLNYDM